MHDVNNEMDRNRWNDYYGWTAWNECIGPKINTIYVWNEWVEWVETIEWVLLCMKLN